MIDGHVPNEWPGVTPAGAAAAPLRVQRFATPGSPASPLATELPSPTRPVAIPVAGPDAPVSGWRPLFSPVRRDLQGIRIMCFVSDAKDCFTVKCSCGYFSLTHHPPRERARATAHCVICGARKPLGALLDEWHDRHATVA